MLKRICLLGASILFSISLSAQAFPSAEGPGLSVWAGASVSTYNPDYGCAKSSPFSCSNQLIGISPFVNTNGFLLGRIGAEGRAEFLHWHGPGGLTESSYLAGPRVYLYRYRKLTLSGDFLIGLARFNSPNSFSNGNYLAYAPGAIFDYRINRRLIARGAYEYQSWPSFKSLYAGSGHGGLTPNGFSIGVSYAIFH